VLGEERPLRFQDIPLPIPARGNWGRLLEQCEHNYIRDVAISRHKDTIKYMEMEIWPPRDSTPRLLIPIWSGCACRMRPKSTSPGGWKTTTWSMPIPVCSLTDWQPGCEVDVKDIATDTGDPDRCTNNLLSSLSGRRDAALTLQKLPMAYMWNLCRLSSLEQTLSGLYNLNNLNNLF
jgi:hypothetical protein